jgi:hypothetical protein
VADSQTSANRAGASTNTGGQADLAVKKDEPKAEAPPAK